VSNFFEVVVFLSTVELNGTSLGVDGNSLDAVSSSLGIVIQNLLQLLLRLFGFR
jgi:hypothetical protein